MARATKIVVVERERERALMIVDGLRDAVDADVLVIGDQSGIAAKIAAAEPDIVLIDVSDPNRDVLEELTLASSPLDRPVAVFVDRDDDGAAQAAIESGVSAYVVDGLKKERIKPVLDAAVARFRVFARMRAELAATKAALAERKTIDRAKGLLMKAKGLSEEQAYALLRKTAMDQGRKLGDVAQALVTAADLLQ